MPLVTTQLTPNIPLYRLTTELPIPLQRKLVQSMTPEEQRRRDISMSYDNIKELKHQLLTDNILTTVASKDGNIVGCATWTVHLGTQTPTPLQRYVRQLTYEVGFRNGQSGLKHGYGQSVRGDKGMKD
jgi:hypothetical protein